VPLTFGLVNVIEDLLPTVLVMKPAVTMLGGEYPFMLVVTGLSKKSPQLVF
jgi:hypothetical protein